MLTFRLVIIQVFFQDGGKEVITTTKNDYPSLKL